MNIQFEQIIERANKRKDQLVEIAAELETLTEHIAHLEEDLAYFENLGRLVCALDQEGRQMIALIATYATYVGGAAGNLRGKLFTGDKPLLLLAVEASK